MELEVELIGCKCDGRWPREVFDFQNDFAVRRAAAIHAKTKTPATRKLTRLSFQNTEIAEHALLRNKGNKLATSHLSSLLPVCSVRPSIHHSNHSTSTNRPASQAFFAAFCSTSISPLVSHIPLNTASLPSFFNSSYGWPYSTTHPLSSTSTLS